MNVVVYIHGKGGSAAEAAHYKPLFPACDVVGLDYQSDTPWDAGAEIRTAIEALRPRYDSVLLVANSIGAFFAMHAKIEDAVARAWFISPVVDMEALIAAMMAQAGVTETALRDRGEITTDRGEVLSWDYLCYVRSNPLRWDVPTDILYGSGDALTSRETITAFAAAHDARLTVMEGGEHWFHTKAQLQFLDDWLVSTSGASAPGQPAQLRRITRYEKLMREAETLLDAGDRSAALREKCAALEAYYTSETWKRDFADDEAGLLPKDLPRGVLSEDGIYNLLERCAAED